MRQSFDQVTGADQRTRDAAIAAMGQRLAAASLRSRQKAAERSLPAEMSGGEPASSVTPPARSPVLVADRSQAFVRDIAPLVPPRSRRRALTAIGRAATLASMASAGFAVVLLAQNPRWSVLHHAVPVKAQPSTPAEIAGPPIPAAKLAENTVSNPAPLAAPAPARVPAAGVPPAIQPAPSAEPMAAPPDVKPILAPRIPVIVPRPSRPMQVQLAAFSRPRPAVAKHVQVTDHYALPRWITEARQTARPLIMSPPPHDLEVPAQLAVHAPPPPVQLASSVMPERPRPVLPPLPRPRIVYAYAGYAAPPGYPGPPSGLYGGYGGPSYPPPYGYPQTPLYPP